MVRVTLSRLGKDLDELSLADIDLLSDIDEIHCLGRKATLDLAELLRIRRGDIILDIGCGIGGPARRLAIKFGCRVVGIDVTEGYVALALKLSQNMGFPSSMVGFRVGDGIDIPFRDETFDVVWIEVAASNISQRDRLYGEIERVLKPGGRVGIFDILAGPGGEPHFPVPWGYDASTSALLSSAATEALLCHSGLKLVEERDVSEEAAIWFAEQVRLMCRAEGPPILGLHVLLPKWGIMSQNQLRNLEEKRIFFRHLLIEKPAE